MNTSTQISSNSPAQATGSASPRRNGTTDEFAAQQLVKAQSVRKRYSKTGSYFGTRPQKLSSGRLAWPLDGE
jgi:hypothetical protein